MEELDAILQGDLSDEHAFKRAVDGVETAEHDSSAKLAQMIGEWDPKNHSLQDACKAQEELASRCDRVEQLLAALDAVCAESIEMKKKADRLDNPLTKIAALSSVPILQNLEKDSISNSVPQFVNAVTKVLDEVWADDSHGEPKERLEMLRQCVMTFEDITYASCVNDGLSCPQYLLIESNSLFHVAHHVACMAVRPPAAGNSEIQTGLGHIVAQLEKAACSAQDTELKLRVDENKSILVMNGEGLRKTSINKERLTSVNTAFNKLCQSLQNTMDNWINAAPFDGKRLAMSLYAEAAEDVVRHLLLLDVIREKECNYLNTAITPVVALYDSFFSDGNDEQSLDRVKHSWLRLKYLNDALMMTMGELEKHWVESYSSVLDKEEMITFVRAAFSDVPKRKQLLATIASSTKKPSL